ncbi:hypothetical protein F5146DRAFT_677778 [Armillaria mellea]|nr:hypothetical protein F5146DRAFT_677778 [Armillaria mellea]
MTTCLQINRTWKAAYAPIASRDRLPTLHGWTIYATYPRPENPYHDCILQLTRSITHFVDLRENEREGAAYRYLVALPNILDFQALFSRVQYISLQLLWIGTGQDPRLWSFRGILIYARYDRFLVTNFVASTRFPGPYEVLVIDGVRHIRQSTYIRETQLGSLGSRDINKRLWVAFKRWYRTRCLASLFYHREFKHAQSSLPARVFPARGLVASLLERKKLY